MAFSIEANCMNPDQLAQSNQGSYCLQNTSADEKSDNIYGEWPEHW